MVKDSDIVNNLYELYSFLSENGVAKIKEKYPFSYIFTEASSWPNAIYLQNNLSDVTYDSIASLKDLIISGECPRLLLLNENQINDKVSTILRENMFLPMTIWSNMVSENINISFKEDSNVDFYIKVIDSNNIEELSDWLGIVEPVLFKNQNINKDLFRQNIKKSFLKLIIGYYNGTPAATTLLFTGTMAGVYMVATMPSFRRKGLGRIMLSYTFDMAKKYGYNNIVLQSTKEGFDFYISLGFKSLNKIYLFYQIQK